ncbi:MAG: metal-dependent hydrolase [Lautropia sp.]|nr:metal-dependent hydrolase [Lautropia sp.]
MDSVTQAALGAAIGVAVMGRRTAIWKAALWGGVCGTLPDLDVFIDHGDAIRNMTLHRAQSHSLFFLSLVSPLLAWLVTRLHGNGGFGNWWLATWLALVTHPLLDWLTVYGTQLGLPFSDFPFAVGSVFVIDPLYTLPLVIGLVAALVAARRRAGAGRLWNLLGLAVATAYLGWGVLAQVHVTGIARSTLSDQGIRSDGLLVTPSPFNSVLWRVLATEGDDYLEGFYSLLDPDRTISFQRHPRGQPLIEQHRDNWYVQRIAWFSRGFFRLRRDGEALLLSDLRMGQEPAYTFTFILVQPTDDCADTTRAPGACSQPVPADPSATAGTQRKPALVPQQRDLAAALSWLWQRIGGDRIPFPKTQETT